MSRHIEECRRELSRVIELLRGEPGGLSITDISRSLDMNRNSVSKYLNMLVISGRVDMRSIGVSKVYTLSDRVPISSLLDFSSDAILVLNGKQEIVMANANFLAFAGHKRDDVIGRILPESALPIVSSAEVLRQVGELVRDGRVYPVYRLAVDLALDNVMDLVADGGFQTGYLQHIVEHADGGLYIVAIIGHQLGIMTHQRHGALVLP